MGARQSNPESEALITSGEALQLCVDPLSPAFLANRVMRSLILAGGTPTASMKRALGWLKHDRQARGADPATSRLLNFPGLEARPPPEKRKWEGEQLDVIEAALRMEYYPNPPPRGIKWGKVELRALQRMLSTPWTYFQTGHWRGVDPARLKLDVMAAAAFGFLGREEGDVKALARFELTTPKASEALLFVGSRFALLGMQFQEDGSGRIGTIKSWSRGARKFLCRFDDGSEEKLGVRALFGNIVKSRSLEGGVELCGKTEVDVLNWYKGEKQWLRSGKKGTRGLKRGGVTRGDGPSGFFGVRKCLGGRWEVQLSIEGEVVHVGTCDEKEDAARLADLLLVVMREEAPKNYPQPFVEFLEAGGDVPADLVAAALRRVGDVRVSGAKTVGAAEAPMAASSFEAKIAGAAADPELRPLYFTGLKVAPGADWTLPQAEFLEGCGVITVGDLALLDVDKKEGELANVGRETLWRWKGAAAALLGVDDIGELPKLKGWGGGRPPTKERTPKHQRTLDVASRWVAHTGTPDPAFVKDYAKALAVIAKSSGGDGGAEPPQKKRHC